MSLRITEARSAEPKEWDSIWRYCDYATYYHSREWAEIWQEYTNNYSIPDARIIAFSDGKAALITCSLHRRFNGYIKQHILSPAGTYGGWLSNDDLTERHGELIDEYIDANFKCFIWRLNPYNSNEKASIFKEVKDDETHALDLECGFECIYKRWTKGHASAARKACKAGVEVRLATNLQDWQDYFKVYEDTLKRWGGGASSRYDWSLFKHILELSSPNIKLWLAEFEGQIIAGALCFYAKKHVGYWHGAALSEYFNLRPVNLLMFEVIKDSCEQGFQWFDFNPSGGHEGVRKFKKSFGAKPISCPVIFSECQPHKLISRLSGLLKRSVRNNKRF